MEYFATFSDVLHSNQQVLNAADLGSNQGRFTHNLATQYPGVFNNILGIDCNFLPPSESTPVRFSQENLEHFLSSSANKQRYDIAFLNSPASAIQRIAFKQIPQILSPNGIAIFTFSYHMIYNSVYQGFETQKEVASCLDQFVELLSATYSCTIIPTDENYPKADYERIPGIIVGKPKRKMRKIKKIIK